MIPLVKKTLEKEQKNKCNKYVKPPFVNALRIKEVGLHPCSHYNVQCIAHEANFLLNLSCEI